MRTLFISLTLIFAAFLLALSTLTADAMEPDKEKHFIVSAACGAGTGAIAAAEDGLTVKSGSIAFAVALLPGLGKEIADRETTGFDWHDMKYNALGAALGVTLAKTGYVVFFGKNSIGLSGRF